MYTSFHTSLGVISYQLAPEPFKATIAILSHPVGDLLGEAYMGGDWWVKEIGITALQLEIGRETGKLKEVRNGMLYGNLFDGLDKWLFGGSASSILAALPFADYLSPLMFNLAGQEIIHNFFHVPVLIQLTAEETFMVNILSVFVMREFL